VALAAAVLLIRITAVCAQQTHTHTAPHASAQARTQRNVTQRSAAQGKSTQGEWRAGAGGAYVTESGRLHRNCPFIASMAASDASKESNDTKPKPRLLPCV
jgi:hypothetical protein